MADEPLEVFEDGNSSPDVQVDSSDAVASPDAVESVEDDGNVSLRSVIEDFAQEDLRRYDALSEQISEGFGSLRSSLGASAKADGETGEDDALTVSLAADQWSYVRDSMRMQSTFSLFSLIFSCVICGVLLWGLFTRGWVRG